MQREQSRRHRFDFLAFCAGTVALATPLPAQDKSIAEAITAGAVIRHISVITDDSMTGRAVPSPGLEKTAQYIASQFQQLGLRPGYDSSWFQSYPISPRLNFARSRVLFHAGGKSVAADFTTAARLATEAVPEQPIRGKVLLVAGTHTAATIGQAANRGRIVLYVLPSGMDAATGRKVADTLRHGNKGLIIVSNADTARFTRRLAVARRQPVVRVIPASQQLDARKNGASQLHANRESTMAWAIYVQPDVVPDLPALLAASNLDLASMRSDTALLVRELPELEIEFDPVLDRSLGDSATAKNVVGILEGTDPKLKEEYVIISAHMDRTGPSSETTDSIENGFDDNASGTAGILELAKAFSQPGARPRRSLVFLATSGGDHGFWGSRNFAASSQNISTSFTTLRMIFGDVTQVHGGLGGRSSPLYIPVVNLSLDGIGRNTQGSLRVDGLSELKLATPMDWIAAAQPELGLSLVDGGPVAAAASGQYAFARAGIPSLNFHTTMDTSRTQDSLSAIDADQTVSIIRYVLYLAHSIANAGQRPMLTAEGRRHFLDIR